MPEVWPYPLLCLAWRFGWGGRRLVNLRESAGPGSLFRAVPQGIEWPPAGAEEPSADREPVDALIAPDAHSADDVDAPDGASTILGGVTILLRQSPLAGLIASPERAAAAATGTAHRIRPELSAGHDVPLPSFWRPALAAWAGWREPRWVPRPRPRWDPATWTLVGVLETAWEATGTTFLGRERPALFRVVGTRRMAARYGWSPRRTLACGRTAHRIWRHWFERTEQARLDRLRTWPVPQRVAVTLEDPILAYRTVRVAVRTGRQTPVLDALPVTLRGLLGSLASASVMDLRPPVVPDRPAGLRPGVARALLVTPLGVAAVRSGANSRVLWTAANATAARLLWALTAPWPWRPRPVVRGPRRARQEARCRAAAWRP